jgi:two-component system chemotaxis sensor kinase CheA
MTIQDDETLQMYLEESLDHLADIENDFLEIEANGANIDENMVNKVYRAAHSIKGGAGFMGLNNIKDLTHEMENILGKIRSRDLVPTPDIVNVLLKASDTLKDLLNDILNSNEVDISMEVESLKAILAAEENPAVSEPAAEAAADDSELPDNQEVAEEVAAPAPVSDGTESADLTFPGGTESLVVATSKLAPVFEQRKFIYMVKILINEDIKAKQKTCHSVIEEMDQTGVVIAANFAVPELSSIDEAWVPDVPAMVFLFGTILKPSDINVLFEISESQIYEMRSDYQLYNLTGDAASSSPTEAAAQPAAQPEPVPQPAVPTQADEPPQPAPVVEEIPTDIPPEEPEPAMPAEAIDSQPSMPNIMDDDPADTNSAKKASKFEHETSLRVHVSLLDQLMTLAGELVLSRNQLLQSMVSNDQRGSETAGQRIDLITSELQEAIMLTRMQSIGNVFNKFPRVVRDLARSLNKNVELTLEGKDVELDKTIIEAIGDPLTHLVRNSVDHGIETPDIRKKIGKSPVGQIYLKAYHEAGQVNIEITDNGKGLDGNALAAKALAKGLIAEDQLKVMSEREKTNLIFLPGFSTAEKITDVSGRGVGMDVVKTNLDKLGGIIDIDSTPGQGTTIRIKLPLTLAIIPCQIVLTGGERYAIPQVNLEELLRIPANQVQNRIERVGDADVVRLRGDLLPLIRLADVIGVETFYLDPKSGEEKPNRRKSIADRRSQKSPLVPAGEVVDEDNEAVQTTEPSDNERKLKDRRYHASGAMNIVVVSTGAMKYGLVVDDLHDSEEIVVKPLGRDLKQCKGYAGATIMGDGRVALILDVSNLAQMSGLTTVEGTARATEVAEHELDMVRAAKDRQSLLVFRSAEDEQFAAPLNLVERIEKIKRTDIEDVGGKRVIKYRGGTLPLFSLDEAAMVKPLAESDNLLVIVFVVANREVGLLSIGPVDAIETRIEIDGSTLRQTGIMGSAIINDNTTLLIDIFEIVQALNPQWFEEPEQIASEEGDMPTILFAEDSTFFRNQVKGTMEQSGFNVLEAEDGLIAWDLLEEKIGEISLVVTDIEMPNMDGFELTNRIKQNPKYSHLPVIALTTLAGEEDIARGKEVGIDDYQIKLDREKLMESIFNHLNAA